MFALPTLTYATREQQLLQNNENHLFILYKGNTQTTLISWRLITAHWKPTFETQILCWDSYNQMEHILICTTA